MKVQKYYLEQFVGGGFQRVIHEDGYVHLFDTIEAACESARNLHRYYGIDASVTVWEVEEYETRLPITPEEALRHSAIGVVLESAREKARQEKEVQEYTKRRIRIRKE